MQLNCPPALDGGLGSHHIPDMIEGSLNIDLPLGFKNQGFPTWFKDPVYFIEAALGINPVGQAGMAGDNVKIIISVIS